MLVSLHANLEMHGQQNIKCRDARSTKQNRDAGQQNINFRDARSTEHKIFLAYH
jgi:hypothetical protein